jgi:hypothetical protein
MTVGDETVTPASTLYEGPAGRTIAGPGRGAQFVYQLLTESPR